MEGWGGVMWGGDRVGRAWPGCVLCTAKRLGVTFVEGGPDIVSSIATALMRRECHQRGISSLGHNGTPAWSNGDSETGKALTVHPRHGPQWVVLSLICEKTSPEGSLTN